MLPVLYPFLLLPPNFRRMQCLYWCLPYTESKTEKTEDKNRHQQENTRPALPPPLYFTLLRSLLLLLCLLSAISFNGEVDLYL